ncbi:hypothetical protein QP516_10780 [Micrococcus luteus]|uniref:hypothetical protein n=1 Tax=Micrococcus luteus TaxID=1270 RepID=UPI000C7A5EC7|nr:hypothetical protein [Micrococcus luteus]MDK7330255.1 hypothetical protein [Micrococcus luteus]PLA41447.1 hypothetical protein CYJ94_11180 [Micrococcus luteus]
MTATLTIPATAQALTVETHQDGTATLSDRTQDQLENGSFNEYGTTLWTGDAALAALALSDLGFKDLHGVNAPTGPSTITEARAYYRGTCLDQVRDLLAAEA